MAELSAPPTIDITPVLADGRPVVPERPPGVPKNQFWKGMPKPAGSGRTGGIKSIHKKSLEYARSLMPLVATSWPDGIPKPEEPIDLIAYAFITRKDPFEYAINAKLGDKSPYVKELKALEDGGEATDFATSKKNAVQYNNAVGFIPFDVWMKLGEILLNYWYHKLQATTLQGPDGGPVQLQPVIAAAMASNPQMRRIAEGVQSAIPAVTQMVEEGGDSE